MDTENKCCRLIYFYRDMREYAKVIRHVHGDIKVYDNTGEGELVHGWIMDDDTFPCTELRDGGCGFQLDGKRKPARCVDFPNSKGELDEKIGYVSDGTGTCSLIPERDGTFSGTCNGCGSLVPPLYPPRGT